MILEIREQMLSKTVLYQWCLLDLEATLDIPGENQSVFLGD